MSSGMNVQLNYEEPLYKELFTKLSKKLRAEIEEFDDSLPTYILQISAMKSYPKEKCLSNLEFLGKSIAQSLTDWLWHLMDPYRDGRRDVPTSAPSIPKSVISRESLRKIVKNNEEEKESANMQKEINRKRIAPEKELSDPAPTERISKLLQRLKEKEREEQNEPHAIEKSHPSKISLKKQRNNFRSRPGDAPFQKHFQSKLQEQSNSCNSKKSHCDKESPGKHIKLQKEISEPIEKSEIGKEQTSSEQKPNQLDKKKIRCKNWPACKDESCPYAHPKEICKNFPNCKYGNRCLNIHPQTPCKFGIYCNRPDCAFTHPPRFMDMSMFSMPFPMFGGRPKNMQAKYKSSKPESNEGAKPEKKHS